MRRTSDLVYTHLHCVNLQEFGEVKAARLAYKFRRPLGYAFVTLADPSAANAALVKV